MTNQLAKRISKRSKLITKRQKLKKLKAEWEKYFLAPNYLEPVRSSENNDYSHFKL